MRELIEDLHIDTEAIALDRDFCAGVGRAYKTQLSDVSDAETLSRIALIAATNFRRAGCHAVLLDDDASETYFASATELYGKVNRSYSLVMASLTEDPESLRASAVSAQAEGAERHDVDASLVFSFVTLSATKEGRKHENERLRAELSAKENSATGVLGTPVGVYLDLADSLARNDEGGIARSLLFILSAYDSGLRSAMHNRYHWHILNMPFHPFEPDVMGVLFMVEFALRQRDTSLLRQVPHYPLSPTAQAIVVQSLDRRFPS